MDSQYKLLSELLSDQAAFITSPKTSLANYWGALPPLPPSAYGPEACRSTERFILMEPCFLYHIFYIVFTLSLDSLSRRTGLIINIFCNTLHPYEPFRCLSI